MSQKFKSELEKRVSQKLKDYKYECTRYPYTSSHIYTPDFTNPNVNDICIEVKGYFRTSQEAKKYVDITTSNPSLEIVFLFDNPDTRMPGAKRRKDGTYRTMKDWAAKYNFKWFTMETINKMKRYINAKSSSNS